MFNPDAQLGTKREAFRSEIDDKEKRAEAEARMEEFLTKFESMERASREEYLDWLYDWSEYIKDHPSLQTNFDCQKWILLFERHGFGATQSPDDPEEGTAEGDAVRIMRETAKTPSDGDAPMYAYASVRYWNQKYRHFDRPYDLDDDRNNTYERTGPRHIQNKEKQERIDGHITALEQMGVGNDVWKYLDWLDTYSKLYKLVPVEPDKPVSVDGERIATLLAERGFGLENWPERSNNPTIEQVAIRLMCDATVAFSEGRLDYDQRGFTREMREKKESGQTQWF